MSTADNHESESQNQFSNQESTKIEGGQYEEDTSPSELPSPNAELANTADGGSGDLDGGSGNRRPIQALIRLISRLNRANHRLRGRATTEGSGDRDEGGGNHGGGSGNRDGGREDQSSSRQTTRTEDGQSGEGTSFNESPSPVIESADEASGDFGRGSGNLGS